MQDAGISLSCLARLTTALPAAALLACLATALLAQYEKATTTHCEVSEFLPSISAVVGVEPQRFLWSAAIAVTTGPRLLFCQLQRSELATKFPSHQAAVRLNTGLNTLEILALLTLSLVPSQDIFVIHATAFSAFLLSSLSSMLVLTYYLHDGRRTRLKRVTVKLSLLCVIMAAYFYQRHNAQCEPYVYSLFAACEYAVVGLNMVWHTAVIRQFCGLTMLVERSGDFIM